MKEYAGMEKRRSFRVNDGITAKIAGKIIKRRIPVINISRHGALLKTRYLFRMRRIHNILLYLPGERIPLSVKARVARTVTMCSAWGFHSVEIGVEFLNLTQPQEEALSKTMDYIIRGQRARVKDNR